MKIILGFLASLAAAQNYSQITGLASDLGRRYTFSRTVVLFKEGTGDMSRAFSIGKTLMMSVDGRVLVKSVTNYVDVRAAEGTDHGRSFYLILGDRVNVKEELEQLSYSINVEETVWLVCLDEKTSLQEYFRDVNIVYNMDMLVMQPLPDGNEKVTEVYRLAKEHPLKVLDYGVWSAGQGLKSEVSALFYQRRQNLEGINFKVAVKKSNKPWTKGGHQTGIFRSVWMDLQLKLNFTSTFTVVNESELFLPGGIIGFMNRKKLDVGLTEVTMSRDSCSVTHCLKPVVMTKNRLYFKKTRLSISWDSVLKPFHKQTWITIFLWFVISSVGVDAFFRVSKKYGLEDQMIDYQVVDSVLTVFNAVCQKGSATVPDSFPCRVIFFVSYSVAAILFTVYSASLASFVSVQEPYFPFQNLKQLLEDGTYTLQPIRYSDVYMFYANATDPLDRDIYVKLIGSGSSLPGSKREALERVCGNEKVVYIGTEYETKKAVMEVNRKGHCEIISPEEPVNTAYITILLSRTSHFKELFNVQLASITLSGLVNRNMRRAWKEVEWVEENKFAGVGMTQVVQIYAILTLGIIASFLIFIIEKFACGAFKKNKKRSLYPGCGWEIAPDVSQVLQLLASSVIAEHVFFAINGIIMPGKRRTPLARN